MRKSIIKQYTFISQVCFLKLKSWNRISTKRPLPSMTPPMVNLTKIVWNDRDEAGSGWAGLISTYLKWPSISCSYAQAMQQLDCDRIFAYVRIVTINRTWSDRFSQRHLQRSVGKQRILITTKGTLAHNGPGPLRKALMLKFDCTTMSPNEIIFFKILT